MADIQHNSNHGPFHCTNVMACEHLTNNFNKCLSNKVYNTFKDLFSNINIDSVQETCPKISIYNNIIAQFVKETNLKYSLDIKFTKLEAPDVGLFVKTFQLVGHSEDQQVSRQPAPLQHLEPPQQPPHQHTQMKACQTAVSEVALLTDKLLLNEQWVEND